MYLWKKRVLTCIKKKITQGTYKTHNQLSCSLLRNPQQCDIYYVKHFLKTSATSYLAYTQYLMSEE